MALWYELITEDKQFNELIAQEIGAVDRGRVGGSGSAHPHLRYILQGMDSGVSYTSGMYGSGTAYDNRGTSTDKLEKLVSVIGEALFNTLVEVNPDYVGKLIGHGLRINVDSELYAMEQRLFDEQMGKMDAMMPHLATMDANEIYKHPASMPKLRNDDYEFWWDYSEDGDEIYIMSDYDGTPEDGFTSFEFDSDDADDTQYAIDCAEETVSKLCRNTLDINDVIAANPRPPSKTMKTDPSVAAPITAHGGSTPSPPTVEMQFKSMYGGILAKDVENSILGITMA